MSLPRRTGWEILIGAEWPGVTVTGTCFAADDGSIAGMLGDQVTAEIGASSVKAQRMDRDRRDRDDWDDRYDDDWDDRYDDDWDDRYDEWD